MEKNSLEEYANLLKAGDKAKISEASIKRVASHIKQTASTSFAIITAERGANTNKQNLALNNRLEHDIRSLDLGFFKLRGHWKECQDKNLEYKDCPENQKKPTNEISLFVPNMTKKHAVRLAKKYDQDTIVYQGPETNNAVEVITKSGSTFAKLGKFSPNTIGDAYSKVKGRTFTFEGFQWMPHGMLTNLALNALMKQ